MSGRRYGYAEFERIEEDRNRNIEGTGLGMNITIQLLELLGSRLQVKSTYGEGLLHTVEGFYSIHLGHHMVQKDQVIVVFLPCRTCPCWNSR